MKLLKVLQETFLREVRSTSWPELEVISRSLSLAIRLVPLMLLAWKLGLPLEERRRPGNGQMSSLRQMTEAIASACSSRRLRSVRKKWRISSSYSKSRSTPEKRKLSAFRSSTRAARTLRFSVSSTHTNSMRKQ
jgi:hypothetical protein